MNKLIPAALAALMAGLVASAPALAHHGDENQTFGPVVNFTQFQEAAANTGFTLGTVTTDSSGHQLFKDSVYTGTLSGTPIGSGVFRIDANFLVADGGAFSGGWMDTDSSGNFISGSLQGTVDNSGNAAGSFTIGGGGGIYANIVGQGTFSGPLNNASNTGTTTFSGQWAIPTQQAQASVTGADADDQPEVEAHEDNTRPGNGFGDRNHEHTGAPGGKHFSRNRFRGDRD